jgi:transposase
MAKTTKTKQIGQRATGETVTHAGRELFVGLDLAKKSWKLTIRTHDLVLRSWSTIPKPESVVNFLRREYQGAKIRLAYEAGCFGFWILDVFQQAGIDVVVVAPHQLPSELVKTDALDSAKLARLLAGGLLRGIWVPTKEQRLDRAVVRRRTQLLRTRSRLMDQVKKFLLFHGVEVEEPTSGSWTLRYLRDLNAVEFSDELYTESFRAMLDHYLDLHRRVKEQERRIHRLAEAERYAKRLALLRTIPGIGLLSGMTVLVELQDVRRFSSVECMASYLGLNPQQYSTGEQKRMGHITRAGNQFVRHALVELAWRCIRRDPALLEKYEALRRRRGSKIAIVAIARRVALRIRRVLTTEEGYKLGVAA